LGVIPIWLNRDFPSLAFSSNYFNCSNNFNNFDNSRVNNKFFIPFLTQLNEYGGCSLVAECEPVALEMGVRFSPTAFWRIQKGE
jgi:hypothetical protein